MRAFYLFALVRRATLTHPSSPYMSKTTAARMVPKALLCVAIGLAITGCSNSDTASTDGTDASNVTLNLYNWSEYMPQEILDGFEKETGISVNYTTFDSNEAK